ncbi:MAG: hypothetical protein DWP95_06365 [Proteobacteria bacterium]|nr:MAG: hypothetical protein DWP95_06365 [Pseudomonadota bacterium]
MKLLLLSLMLLVEPTYAAVCEGQYTTVAAVQGSGSKSPLLNQEVVVKAVVTGIFTQKGGLDGFFIQSLQPDNDPQTSEGLFVYTGQWQPAVSVADVVLVSGQVSEQYGTTQLRAINKISVCDSNYALPTPHLIQLPLDQLNLETLENMRVEVKATTVTDIYQYLKFGEITVSSERLFSITSLVEPGLAVEPLLVSQKRDQLVIDDGRLQAYARPFNVGRDGRQPVSAGNPMRTGYSVDAVGVLSYLFGQYKLQPTQAISIGPQSNIRSPQPDQPAGDFRVATFNVENWFTDFNDGSDHCGNIIGMGCRGAKNEAERQRQLNKLVAVINRLDAAVIGLQELQNNPSESINTLVDALNKDTHLDKWRYIDAGQLGQDVIKVGLIFQPKEVQPVGDYAVLNRDRLADFEEHRHRIVLAQTFKHLKSDKLITVASLHLKSKSCRDAEGVNQAQQDGQGCYNPARVRAARQIVNWLKHDPTAMGANLQLIVGDFNSYQKEDPIVTFEKAGFINLAREYLGVENWTTSYRGKVGSLDYIMANKPAAELATGVSQWHINSDEIRDFGYRLTPLADQIERPDKFYQANPFSSSDHDPVLAGFQLSVPDSKETNN